MTLRLAAAAMMIASGSLHAVVNAVIKSGKNKMAGRATIDGTAALILLPGLLVVPLPHGAWGWLVASTAIHALYLLAVVRTYELADFSAAYPIMRGLAPPLTAIVSVALLHERANAAQIAGIAIVAGGILILSIGRHLSRPALGWAAICGCCTAAYTVADAHGVRAAPTVASFIVWDFVLMGPMIVAQFAVMTRGAVFADMRRQWGPGAIAGALSIGTYGLALAAFARGPTAPLAALRETGMVTALLIGVFWLREPVTAHRIAAIGAILCGAALILLR